MGIVAVSREAEEAAAAATVNPYLQVRYILTYIHVPIQGIFLSCHMDAHAHNLYFKKVQGERSPKLGLRKQA